MGRHPADNVAHHQPARSIRTDYDQQPPILFELVASASAPAPVYFGGKHTCSLVRHLTRRVAKFPIHLPAACLIIPADAKIRVDSFGNLFGADIFQKKELLAE